MNPPTCNTEFLPFITQRWDQAGQKTQAALGQRKSVLNGFPLLCDVADIPGEFIVDF